MGKLAGLHWHLTTMMTRVMLRRLHRAELGAGLRALGLPVVSRAPGSRIFIGERAVLCSHSKGTALGVSRPVILRTLADGALLAIGDDCGASGAVICAAQSVRIGDRCLIGAGVKIFDTDFHPQSPANRRYARPDWPRISKPVTIGDDVFLGTGAIICKGVAIGDGSIVAAGSVVVSSVTAGTIVAGNPARPVKVLP